MVCKQNKNVKDYRPFDIDINRLADEALIENIYIRQQTLLLKQDLF